MTFEPSPQTERPETEASVRPLELVNIILRRWRLTFGLPMLLAMLAAGIALIIPPMFTATTTFVPENDSPSAIPAGLAGIAGQFGVSVGGGGSQSPQFYVALVKSRDIMERVLLSRFGDPRSNALPGDSVTLLDFLEVEGATQSERVFRGLLELRKHVSVNADQQTSIVQIEVQSSHPSVAAAVADQFVALIDEFNTTTRQFQARAERVFTNDRVVASEQELRQSERDLRIFLERNRRWNQSPELVVEEGWLQRRVTIAQEVYLTLRREHETARIQEVNDTPVITILDRAIPPEQRSSPRRTLIVVVMFVFGTMVGIFAAFVWEFLERMSRRGDKDLEELRRFFHMRPRIASPTSATSDLG